MEAKEVARGYRAEALKLKSVVNGEERDARGKISDFIFGKDGNIYCRPCRRRLCRDLAATSSPFPFPQPQAGTTPPAMVVLPGANDPRRSISCRSSSTTAETLRIVKTTLVKVILAKR